LVRTDDERAQRLRASGVHVVVGDLHDRRTLLPALQGVSSVFVAYPVAAGIVEALLNLASATIELGISPHVVIMGAAAADHSSPSGIARAHALSEEMLLELGVSFTSIRGSAFFYENVLLLHGDTIRGSGEFANSFGDARPAWISGSDAADLCATVLLDPETYANVPYVYPPGYALMSQKDIAAIISEETGREVHYRYLTPEEWGRDLRTRTDNHPMVEHITNQSAMCENNTTILRKDVDPDALAVSSGRPALSFREFVRQHRAELGAVTADTREFVSGGLS
jgi:uncharacterized protein YbjT (DUF2867 family)